MAPQTLLGVACLAIAIPLPAQDAAADQGVDVRSRVSRTLKGLREAPAYECRTEIKAKASALMRGMGGGKSQTLHQTTVKEGDTLCWSKSDGDEVLAHRAGRWVVLDRDGDWIPCRKPQGTSWQSEFLADPTFLADRLLALLPKVKWEAAGAAEVGGKAVRVYRCKVDLDQANHLVRTGALPEGGGLGGGIGRQIIMIGGGGGGGMRMPEPERQIEIELYEDAASKLPARIVARGFEEGGMGNVRIAVQGLGGQEEEEEEGDEGGKKKKPAYTLTLDFGKFGDAKADLLGKKARTLLGQG